VLVTGVQTCALPIFERGVRSVEINGRAAQGLAIPFEDPSFGDNVQVTVFMGR
jgi:hypothetical protein